MECTFNESVYAKLSNFHQQSLHKDINITNHVLPAREWIRGQATVQLPCKAGFMLNTK